MDATRQDVWRQLVASSKKRHGSIYTRYVNRNAAIPLTYLLWRLGLHPNTVSLLSSAVTHAALVLLLALEITLPIAIVAYLILVLGYMLDSCDGQLARVSQKTSQLGAWLDHSLDMVKILNFNMVLGYLLLTAAMAEQIPLGLAFAAVFLNLLCQPAHFFVITLKVELLGGGATGTPSTRSATGFLALLRNGADYGLFMLLVLLLPAIEVFLYVYLAYGAFYALLFVSHLWRTFLVSSRR